MLVQWRGCCIVLYGAAGVAFAYGEGAEECRLRVSHLALNSCMCSSPLQVTYPGLPEHPGHALLKLLSNEGFGFGGLLGLEFPTIAVAKTFMQRLQNK